MTVTGRCQLQSCRRRPSPVSHSASCCDGLGWDRAWIAILLFPALLVIGALRGDIWRTGSSPLRYWVVWLGLPRLIRGGANYVTPALAILDIALVFAVFKGDVRL